MSEEIQRTVAICKAAADECRQWSAEAQNPDLRAAYNELAAQWEILAEEIEKYNANQNS